MPSQRRFRPWIFVENFKDDEPNQENAEKRAKEVEKLLSADYIKYYVFQMEVGEETGTLHAQGYFQLKAPKTKSALIRRFKRASLRHREGSHDEARDYVVKERTAILGPWEHGNPVTGGSGQRTDLMDVKSDIDNGKDETYLWENHFKHMIRYRKAFEEYRLIRESKIRRVGVEVITYFGPGGTGKSTYVENKYPVAEGNFWLTIRKGRDRLWWDNYKGEKTVVIDEFEGQVPQVEMKRILDSKPYHLERKGGTVAALYTKIILVSNHHPFDWYKRGMEEPLVHRIFGQHGRKGQVFSYFSREEGAQPTTIDDSSRFRGRDWGEGHHGQ